ncbi:MAG: hypothetical protein FWD18_08945 [Micrococcales bacterium]|nr:hypothetical protein [Micrococcales bacterium]
MITAVLIALTTAIAALVVEDLLPAEGGFGYSPPFRWALFAVSAPLLVLSVYWAWWIRSVRGSAYVVQVQDQAAPRWHTGPLVAKTLQHLNVNMLVERLDLGATGQVELADTVTSLARELRAGQNADDDSTGFSYYPNVLFPAAIALGYQWEPPRGVVLHELNEAGDRDDFFFPLTELTRAAQPRPELIPVPPEPSEADKADDEVRSVSVRILLTYNKHVLPLPLHDDAGAIDGFGSFERAYVVGVRGDGDSLVNVKVDPRWHRNTGSDPDGTALLTPAEIVIGAGRALREVLDRHPKAVVVVVGMMPKATTIPLGWYMANAHGTAGFPLPCPWERLVPMHFAGPGRLRPARVHPDQPDDLMKLLDKHGVTVEARTPPARS